MFFTKVLYWIRFHQTSACHACIQRAYHFALADGFETAFAKLSSEISADRKAFAQEIFFRIFRTEFLNAVRDCNFDLITENAKLLQSIEGFIPDASLAAFKNEALFKVVESGQLFKPFMHLTKVHGFRITNLPKSGPERISMFLQKMACSADDIDNLRDIILHNLGNLCPELAALKTDRARCEKELVNKLTLFYTEVKAKPSKREDEDEHHVSLFLMKVAAAHGRTDILQELCEGPNAVPLKILNFGINSALCIAVSNHQMDAVHYISNIFSIDMREGNNRLISTAATYGNVSVLRELREKHGLAAADARACRAINYAIWHGQEAALKELREGYGLEAKDVLHQTSNQTFKYAIQKGYVGVLKELREGYRMKAHEVLNPVRSSLISHERSRELLKELREGYGLEEAEICAVFKQIDSNF